MIILWLNKKLPKVMLIHISNNEHEKISIIQWINYIILKR